MGVAHPTKRVTSVAGVGVSLPLSRLNAFIATTGSTPSTLGTFQDWADGTTFDIATAFAAQAKGMSIALTWEPWSSARHYWNQPSYSDRAIAAGAHDKYIVAFARSLNTFRHYGGGTVTIRLAHEMNGNWYPWAVGVQGNTAADYVAMWRHVHGIFAREHVTNVRWLWAPNVTDNDQMPFGKLFPGRAYIDAIGLSGYNFGTGDSWSRWQSFATVYTASLRQIRLLAPHLPLYLGEIGCSNTGGDKAAWIADMFAQIKARPYITGFVYFDYVTQRDWRVEKNPAVVKAWKKGVASM